MSNAEIAGPHPIVTPQIDALAMSRGLLHKLVDDLTDEQMLSRTCPNGNHPLWCVGHIAVTEQFFLSALAQRDRVLPVDWDVVFRFASLPKDDANAYPSRTELMSGADKIRDALVDWYSFLDETTLASPMPPEFEPFAKSYAQLGASLVMHESFHLGQVSAARRALGLPPLF
jgi:uncharacterized damage-inducible protein DinB